MTGLFRAYGVFFTAHRGILLIGLELFHAIGILV